MGKLPNLKGMKQFLSPRTLQCIGNFHFRLTNKRRGCVLHGIHSSSQDLEGKEFSVGGGQVVKELRSKQRSSKP